MSYALYQLGQLRSRGWRVAVHNDYEQNGKLYTFWLITHAESGIFLKSEGPSDGDCIDDLACQAEAIAR